VKRFLPFAAVFLSILACGPAAALRSPTPAPSLVPPSIPPSATQPPAAVASDTPYPTATMLPLDTPEPAEPTSVGAATETALVQDLAPGLALMLQVGTVDLYMNPVGEPVQSWKDIPVMPQATAGQQFSDNVYSYKANATLVQARSFYDKAHLSMGYNMTQPVTGTTGLGSTSAHDVTYMLTNGEVMIESPDNDPGHVVVIFILQ
jgi:hypothetical protein